MKRKVYVETSVISYLTARPSKTILGAANQQISLAWWETRNQYELLVSGAVLRECGAGDPDAAEKRMAVLTDVPLLLITEQGTPYRGVAGRTWNSAVENCRRCAAHRGRHGQRYGLSADMELSAYRKP